MKTDKNLSFTSGDTDQEHVLVLKKKKLNLWWLLLLLLPLLLLIPIPREVKIHIEEQSSKIAIAYSNTVFTYPERGLFSGITYKSLSDTTDNEGNVVFSGIKEPLWVYLFCKSDSAMVSSGNECHKAENLGYLYESFPRNGYKNIGIPPIAASAVLRVVDAEDLEPLPDADVKIITTVNGSSENSQTQTDPAGTFDINNVPLCGQVQVVASRDGYENDTITAGLFDLSNMSDEEKTLHLVPLKGNVKVVVRNLKTKTLLAGATVTLTINGATSTLKTNTNGVGVGTFDSLRISSTLNFKASKTNYADTTLPASTVAQFVNLPEEQRTMYLRPLTESFVFINTNGSSPLEGVKNQVYINGSLKSTEYSNNQGQFTVVGVMPTDKISITASKSGYNSNSSKVKNAVASSLTTQDSRTIPLSKIPDPPTPAPPVVDNKTSDLKGESGDLRINLQWYSRTDLDLHVYDPCGNEIFFSKRKATCGGGTGILDLDANAIIGTTTRPQENIYWLKPSPGTYKVKVVCFKFRDRPGQMLNYNVSIVDKNGRKDYRGTIGNGQSQQNITHTVSN